MLVCAEGCTQVTGVMMAMLKTGRVLLVCALCVLWCGAGGGCKEVPAHPDSDASTDIERDRGQSQDLSLSETPESHTPGSETLVTNVQQEEVLLPLLEFSQAGTEDVAGKEKARKEDVTKEIGKDEKVGETGKGIQKPEDELISVKGQQSHDKEGLRPQLLNGPHGVGTATPSRGSLPVNKDQRELSNPLQPPLPNSSPHVIQSSTSAAGRGDDKSHENGNETKNSQQPVVGGIQEKNGTGVKAVASTSGEENSRLSVTTLEEMSDATKKGDSNSSTAATAALRSDAGTEGTPTTNHPKQPSTEGATPPGTNSDGEAAPANKYDTVSQSAGSTTAPTTNATTGDTATPGHSDGSTAVSHTTSPLLLLFVVACASAAAVVAA
ncbi:Mucin-associated surface protein (MASP) [Trypanosoma cruzi]|nr:Mucin-associated surface protein (MASP) [Trypanosoma cruzi]